MEILVEKARTTREADLVALGRRLGMAALVESHAALGLVRAIDSGAKLLGINNRDLQTFRTDLATTELLAPRIPAGRVIVAESGIATAAHVKRLLAAGAHAVLVGETLMRAADRAGKIAEFKSVR